MADNSQDPILYTIDEKVNELAKRIDDSNKAAAAKPQNYGPNGTSVKFYFYDALGNLTGESDIKADKHGHNFPRRPTDRAGPKKGNF